MCRGPFRSLRAAPRGCVRREPVSDSRSAAGCAFARPGVPLLVCARSFYPPPGGAAARLCAQGCAGLGSGGIRSYRRWRSCAASWGLGAQRANGAVRKPVSRQLVRLAGFGGKAGRVVARCVCVCAPPARARSELQMPTSQETIQKHEGSSDTGKGSLRSERGPHS